MWPRVVSKNTLPSTTNWVTFRSQLVSSTFLRYDNDDVYVDYTGDGYYLYNRRYPQDRIAIVVYVQ